MGSSDVVLIGDETSRSFARPAFADAPLLVERPQDPIDTQRGRVEIMQRLFGSEGKCQTIGRYVLQRSVGSGGCGVVYLAHDPELDRPVAVKMVRPGHDDADNEARLLREARAIARLEHPNIVAVHDVGVLEEPEAVYIVMEFVDGQPLRDWMRARPRGWREVTVAFVAAGDALAFAHREGIVHRDFKPANVMLRTDGRVVVLDFGLARLVDAEARPLVSTSRPTREGPVDSADRLRAEITEAGTLAGTLGYIAPERLDKHPDTPAGDQYSFCVALFEALAGRRPFHGRTADALLHAQHGGVRWTRTERRRVPRWLQRCLERGLAADPSQRHPSMDALVFRLRAGLRRRRRSVQLLVALGTLTLGVTGALAWTPDALCTAVTAAGHMESVWGVDAHTAVEEAMGAVPGEYGAFAWTRTQRRLDAYAEDWTTMYVEACAATAVHGVQSDEVLDLRMACLQRGKVRLRAAVDVLRAGDAAVVQRAHEVLAALPPVSDCADVARLREGTAVPPRNEAEAVAAVDRLVAQVEVAQAAGQYEHARALLERADAVAAGVDFTPLRTALSLAHASVAQTLADHERAEAHYRDALRAATLDRDWNAVQRAVTGLMLVVGSSHEGVAEALRYRELAEGLAEGDTAREAAVAAALGKVLHAKGDYAAAEAQYRRALTLGETPSPEPDLSRTQYRAGLAAVLRMEAKSAEAETELRSALAALAETLGPDHPDTARTRVTLARLLGQGGRYAEALDEVRRAVPALAASLGPEHPATLSARTFQGLCLINVDGSAAALAEYEAVLEIAQRTLGDDDPQTATTRCHLALALTKQGSYEEAQAQLQRGVAGLQAALGLDHVRVALAVDSLADVLDLRGQSRSAEQHHRRAVAIADRRLEDGHPLRAAMRAGLASNLLAQGRHAQAEAECRTALRSFTSEDRHPMVAAVLHGVVSRALARGGKLEGAEASARRRLALVMGAVGSDHAQTAEARVELADILRRRRLLPEARTLARAGWDRLRQEGVDPAQQARAAFVLAQVDSASTARREPGESSQLAERARQIYAELGDQSSVDEVSAWLRARGARTDTGSEP